MSWFQVLKDDDSPKNREIPSFQEKVMNTARWMRSRRKEILDAVTSDEALEKYREDPDIKKLVEEKNTYFIRDIEFIRKLLTEDTVTTNQNTFKSLKGMLGARASQMAERLELLGKAKKTSRGNVRESTNRTFEMMISDGNWGELLESLGDEKRKSRFNQMIQSNPSMRKKIYDETRDTEYANEFSLLMNMNQEEFVSIDYTGDIADSTVKEYVTHILSKVKAAPVKKNEFIYFEKKSERNMLNLFHRTKGMNPALEFLFDNENFNTSAMTKGAPMMRDSYLEDTLMGNLKNKSMKRKVPIPSVLQDAFDLPEEFLVGGEESTQMKMRLREAKKKSDREFMALLNEYFPKEVNEFKDALREVGRKRSKEVEEGQTYRELLEDIDQEVLEYVNEAMGLEGDKEMNASQLEERKEELRQAVQRIIDGKAKEGDLEMFPGAMKQTKQEHPFLSADFNLKRIMSKKLGIGATATDIVIALQLTSNLTNGALTIYEIRKYFSDVEKIKNAEKVEELNTFLSDKADKGDDLSEVRLRAEEEVRDKFLDEVREDYASARKALIEKIKDTMRDVLKEGRKMGVEFDRKAKQERIVTSRDAEGRATDTRESVSTKFQYLEPYFYLIKLLDIET